MNERLNPFARFKPCYAYGSRTTAVSVAVQIDSAAKFAEYKDQAEKQPLTVSEAGSEASAHIAAAKPPEKEEQNFARRLKALASMTARNVSISPEEVYALLKYAETPQLAELLFLYPDSARVLISAASPAQLNLFRRTTMNFYCTGQPTNSLDILGRALFYNTPVGALVDSYQQLHTNAEEQYFLAALALTADVDSIAYLDLWSDDELKGEIRQLGEMTLDKLRIRRVMIGVAEVIAEQRYRQFLGKAEIGRLRGAYVRLRASMLDE